MGRRKKGLFSLLNVKIKAEEIISSINSCNPKEYKAFNDLLLLLREKEITNIYCLGLGDPCCNLGCRKQVSFILEIAKELNIKKKLFFDPCTCESCKEKLTEMGFDIISKNDNGCYEMEEKTCFFMPHCPNCLYHNLISANLSKGKLKNMIIIGNSFELRADNAKYEVPRVNTLVEESYSAGFIIEKKLDFNDDLLFHSTSLMTVDQEKLPDDENEFWKPRELLFE